MTPRIDMLGQKYGRLTVNVEVDEYVQPGGQSRRMFECTCDCGKVINIRGDYLRNGHVTSCGCLNRELTRIRNARHGDSRGGKTTSEYNSWSNMIGRCENRNHPRYADYGGRGIKVCDRWRRGENNKLGFECFLIDMGRKPSPQHSLDRFPDNDGNYEPGNVRWATPKEQASTQRPRSPQTRDQGTGRFIQESSL